MSLKARLTDDMKTAMKSGDKERLGVIRLVNAAIKQREVDERITLDDAQVLSVLEKMLKQRKDSIQQYDAAGRDDLANVERFELGVIGEMGFASYFLIVWDYMRWAREHGVAVGPGRGSAAGSLVGQMVGVDPGTPDATPGLLDALSYDRALVTVVAYLVALPLLTWWLVRRRDVV